MNNYNYRSNLIRTLADKRENAFKAHRHQKNVINSLNTDSTKIARPKPCRRVGNPLKLAKKLKNRRDIEDYYNNFLINIQ